MTKQLPYLLTPNFSALSMRNRQSWENLPPHLKYTIDNSAAAAPSAVRLMVSLVYLAVLETEMQILKLQERENPQPVCPVMRVASEILALVVELAAFPKHLVSACNYSRIVRLWILGCLLKIKTDKRADIQVRSTGSFQFGLDAS